MTFPDDRTYEYKTDTWPPTPVRPTLPNGLRPQLHFQPQPMPRKKRRLGGLGWFGLIVGFGAVVIGGVIGGAVLLGVDPVQDLVKDKGVRACEAIAAVKSGQKVDTNGLGEGADGLAVLRDAFNHSRYDDLRTAGTEAMDLIRQFRGASGDQATGLAIVAGGQMVQKWSALSGACSAHGVQIPSLTELGG